MPIAFLTAIENIFTRILKKTLDIHTCRGYSAPEYSKEGIANDHCHLFDPSGYPPFGHTRRSQSREWWQSVPTIKCWPLILVALVGGCHRAPIETNEVLYGKAEDSFKKANTKQALAQAEQGLKKCGLSQEWCWEFRLLKAEIILAGQPDAALSVLNVPDNPPRTDLQARRRIHQGWAWYRLSDYPKAEKALREAQALAESCASPLLMAEAELRQGPVFAKLGRFPDADAASRRAIKDAVQSGDAYVQAKAMGNLGYLFLGQSQFEEAIYWFQRTLTLSQQIGATALAAQTFGNLGWCYYRLGDFEQALHGFVQAESSFDQIGNRSAQQEWLGDIGTMQLEAGDFPGAIGRYKQALAIARDLHNRSRTAEWLTKLAVAAIATEQLDAAEKYNQESLAINQGLGLTSEEINNHLNSARIAAARKQYAESEILFQSVVNSPSEDPTPALDARGGLADLYVQTGDVRKAEAQFRSAITTLETSQGSIAKEDYKLSYLSSMIRFYRNYVDFLVEEGHTDRALEVVESSRARILTERIGSPMKRYASVSELQQRARSSKHILLSYWLGPKQSRLWVITPTKFETFTLPAESRIRELVDSYRTAIGDLRDPIDSHHPAGEQLSKILLGPIRELVPAGSRVVVVSDGALHSLNFDTLPAPGDSSKYWIEDVTLSIAPSLGLLLNSRPSRKPPPSLLAIGDPESPGPEYPQLPNSRKEVETIAALFAPPSKVVFEGRASRPSAYRKADAARFSLIHFAAHATANRASPLDSALILSREGTSYALTARDITQIPLNADLVTLSSCRSAGARAYSGEGLVGLTWAFLHAGARQVIAGLWDVSDASTSTLMSVLYGELAHGVPAEDALRTAKLSLLHAGQTYRKPYYWGPFQLYVGN